MKPVAVTVHLFGQQLRQRVIIGSHSITSHCRSVFTGLVWGALLATSAADPGPPELTCGLPLENGVHHCSDGTVDLQWKLEGADRFQLEEQTPEAEGRFALRYEGTDMSSVRSGLTEGTHIFRVRGLAKDGTAGTWSTPLVVETRFMSAARVRALLLVGGLVVLATMAAILHGHFTHRGKVSSS